MSAVELAPAYVAPPEARAPRSTPTPSQAPADTGMTANAARIGHTIDLRQNRTAAWLTGLFATVVCALFASLWLGQFSKTESARGIISATGGFSRLDAPRAGVIKEIYVKQGDQVEAGKPIYLLRFGEAGTGGETAVAADMRTSLQTRANLVSEIDRARVFIEKTREQQTMLGRDQVALFAAVSSQEKSIQGALSQARDKVQRVKALVQQGYATRDLLDSHERTYFEYERQMTDVKLKRVEYKRQDSEKQRELSTLLAEKKTSAPTRRTRSTRSMARSAA